MRGAKATAHSIYHSSHDVQSQKLARVIGAAGYALASRAVDEFHWQGQWQPDPEQNSFQLRHIAAKQFMELEPRFAPAATDGPLIDVQNLGRL